ncbi:MAG TPA: UDP-N-acetylmuramoyl-tripeptide--D-alanyl-D-alanine ligase [Candidatus Eisenbacteria bacterium]|nr:UDP-N-acetylmuramoyl-tripeptide--D-alanyl-D-alanine ligase [Candidatus Eisenbacteria bacterium]
MRKMLENKLAMYAKAVLRREKPHVVAVTGSVGKSSAKEAIAVVLGKRFRVRASQKNYNTEIGLPLAVLGLPSGEGSALKWMGIMWRAMGKAMTKDPDYPKVLVLEMALQHPGDIAKLCDIAPPDVGVVTAIGESHLEFMGSVENIIKEKRVVIERLPKEGFAVLNRDDEKVWAMRAKTKAKVISYGFHEEADVRVLRDSIAYACSPDRECGMHFKMVAGGATMPVFLPHVLGKHGIYAALAAAAVGLAKDMNLVEVSDSLGLYSPPPGRLRYIPGIKHTVLIDDTYNASPTSTLAALEVLRDIPMPDTVKRFAVLGDMLELGTGSEDGHRNVGRKAAECADVLVLVGERMRDAMKSAKEAGAGEDRTFWFATPEEAGRFVQERMKMGDYILVKGSRGMRMEKVVKEVMAEPLDADRLLVEHVE